MIEAGTACYIVKARPWHQPMLGRVVTVTGPLARLPQNGMRLAYPIDAPWLRTVYPRHYHFAEPSSLLPIAGPPRTPLVTRKREPEPA